jgi:hypothetical protein
VEYTWSPWETEVEDHLSTWVQDQPGQHSKTLPRDPEREREKKKEEEEQEEEEKEEEEE